jgi:hypothetical protein
MRREPATSENTNYEKLSANALRLIVEEPWLGLAPDSTHERRFALAELERRAGAFDASQQAAKVKR